jgi:carboxylesterase type B
MDPLGQANKYDVLTQRTGCGNATSPLECLRYLPVEQLNTAINTTNTVLNITEFRPCLDGDFIPKRQSLQLEAGEFVHVPIISGANSDEGASFSPSPVNTTENLRTFMTRGPDGVPNDFATQLLQAYPDDPSVNVVASLGNLSVGPTYGTQWRRSASYFGDQVFIAHRRLTCQTWAAAGVPAYCYRFNAIPAGVKAAALGVPHFVEVAFVFLNLQGVGYLPAAVSSLSISTHRPMTN